jgi:transcriptional regulator with XRE-family HTH domain
MTRKDMGQRKLAELARIGKTRLGMVLHGEAGKRSPMTVDELQIILHVLGTDLVAAYVRTRAGEEIDGDLIDRHDSLISMLCDAFAGLPEMLIVLLEEFDGIDGSEVRRDWAPAVRRAIARRLTEEVSAILVRRARLIEGDDFRL